MHIINIYINQLVDIIMGQILSADSKDIKDQLQFFETINGHQFGTLDIYKYNKPPYEYILNYNKNFIQNDLQLQKYLDLINQLKSIEHKNIAKIHAAFIKEDKTMCIIHKTLNVYSNYYNFTLEQAFLKKKYTKNIFHQPDLVYVFSSLLKVLLELKKKNLIFGQFRLQSIYLSPQGHIKVYLLNLHEENRHSCYYQMFAQNSKLTQYTLAPEQLIAMKKQQHEPNYNIFQAEIFSIGMIMVELMSLDRSKFYYNKQNMEILINKILFSLQMYRNRYSASFIELIKACLNPNPVERPNVQALLEEIERWNKMSDNIVYCIKLQWEGKRESEGLENSIKPKGKFLLNSLAKKLHPSPISTISSSSASLFRTSDPKHPKELGSKQQIIKK